MMRQNLWQKGGAQIVSPAPGLTPQDFAVQSAHFVRFIALDEWAKARLVPDPEGWVSSAELYASYRRWVASETRWSEAVVDGPVGFSRKLGQLLNAKAWAFSLHRFRGERGVSGVRLSCALPHQSSCHPDSNRMAALP